MSDPSTTVGAAQAVSDVTPVIQAIVGAVIAGLGGFAVGLIKRYVGVTVDQATVAKVDTYLSDLAAQEIAKAADNLATKQIDVRSPIVKVIVDQVAAAMPKEMTAVGLTPEAVAGKVAAEFGRLQASMTAVPTPPAPTPPIPPKLS